MTPSPGSGFVAVQPAGSAGAVTLSQFSMHGGPPAVAVAVAVGVADAPAVAVAVAVAVGAGVPVAVAVAVAVGDGVPGVGPTLFRSQTSTKPTPVPLLTPESKAVY